MEPAWPGAVPTLTTHAQDPPELTIHQCTHRRDTAGRPYTPRCESCQQGPPRAPRAGHTCTRCSHKHRPSSCAEGGVQGRRAERAHTKPDRGAAESARISWCPTQQATTAAELGSAGGMKAALDTCCRTTGGGLAADRQCSSQAPSAKSTQICSPRTSASTARTRARVCMGSVSIRLSLASLLLATRAPPPRSLSVEAVGSERNDSPLVKTT